MTVSIRTTLSLLPSGAMGQLLSWDQVSKHLRDQNDTQAERDREARHRLRDQLYSDGGTEAMALLLDLLFKDDTVRELRKRWIKHTRHGAIKRIVNELSSVYAEPAIREVEGEANNDRYQQVQELCRQHEVAIRINRMLNLHRSLLVGFRVRELASGEREPVIDIATPSVVRAVIHPNDSTQVIGWLIRVAHRNYHTNNELDRVPSWVLWTDHERARLNENLFIIGEPEEHGFARNPWVPITRGPMVPGFWPGEEGEDLVAAHMAIWFARICMLKETKSATNQTILSGDLSAMARNQAMDTETPIEAPDGVGVSTVDMSTDPTIFSTTADHILEHAANNYGMSLSLIKHQSATSADSRELMRVPLRELRREQQVPLRAFEKRFAEVQSMVLEKDLPELSFSTKGWSIDFGESQTPLSAKEASLQFEKDRQLGLTNTVDFILEKNPDLTEEAAIAWLKRNVELEVLRNKLMRPLQAINGSMGQSLDEARTPAQNGAVAVAENPTIQEMAS